MKFWAKHIILITNLLCILIVIGKISFAEEKIITVSNTEWAPYTTHDLPTNGIVPEIISEAFSRQGEYKLNFFFRPWARVMLEVEQGKLDGAAAAFYRNDRAKKFLYSDSYMSSTVAFYKRKDLPLTTWKSLEDLKPYTIGIIRKSAYSPEFDAADYLNKCPANTVLKNIELLLWGRIDLMAADTFVAQYYIKKHFPEKLDEFVQLSPILYVNKLHIMFSKNSPDAKHKLHTFNKGLQAIKEDGTLQKILEKYGMKNPYE